MFDLQQVFRGYFRMGGKSRIQQARSISPSRRSETIVLITPSWILIFTPQKFNSLVDFLVLTCRFFCFKLDSERYLPFVINF